MFGVPNPTRVGNVVWLVIVTTAKSARAKVFSLRSGDVGGGATLTGHSSTSLTPDEDQELLPRLHLGRYGRSYGHVVGRGSGVELGRIDRGERVRGLVHHEQRHRRLGGRRAGVGDADRDTCDGISVGEIGLIGQE